MRRWSLGPNAYEQLGRVPRADEVVDAAEALQGLGFAVQALENGRAGAVGDALGAFAADAEGAERLVVALAGRFVHDGGRSWYLTAEAAPPGLFDLGDSRRFGRQPAAGAGHAAGPGGAASGGRG